MGFIDNWLSNIKDVYIKNETKFTSIENEQQRSDLLCELNVIEQVKNIGYTTIVQNAWDRGQKLSIHGWIYRLEDGLIKELDVTTSGKEQVHNIYNYQKEV